MTSFWQDVRYSLRMIAKVPGYAAIAILTLALGIGANTAIFSWINAALLNPAPGLATPSEVLSLTLSKPGDNHFPFYLSRCRGDPRRATKFYGHRSVRLRYDEPDGQS